MSYNVSGNCKVEDIKTRFLITQLINFYSHRRLTFLLKLVVLHVISCVVVKMFYVGQHYKIKL